MDKKWLILTCFFSVLTLIITISCSALIYKTENKKTELNSEEVLATKKIYKNTSVIYEQNNVISFTDIAIGFTLTRNFSISNNNSDTIKYKIEWQNVTNIENQNEHPDKFVYSIKCSNGEKIEEQMPLENKVILDNLELKTNKVNDCELTITLTKDETDPVPYTQSFTGTYKVVIEE